MGEVFLAFGPGGKRVALKLVRRELLHDETVRRRFVREVSLSQEVGGRYTAKLVQADLEASPPWLATEFIDGPTLGDYIRERGPLTGASLRALAVALLEAVAAIHEAGVVHRDLTPNNVLLALDGPKVVDFGIAHHEGASTAITATGGTVGTPSWMAPEQVEGKQPTAASDIFSWAAVVAFASTGRAPFGEGRPEAVLYRVVHGEPNLDGVPEGIRSVLVSALSKDATGRPSVGQLLDGLGIGADADITEAAEQTVQGHWNVDVSPIATGLVTPRSRGRRLLLAAGSATGLALVVVLAVLLLRDPSESEPRPDRAVAPPTTTTTSTTTTTTTTTTAPPPPPPTAPPFNPAALRFDPATSTCSGEPPPVLVREWQVAVANNVNPGIIEIHPVERLTLSIRNKFGTFEDPGANIPLVVHVIAPDGNADRLSTFLQADQWADVDYPPSPFDMSPGAHTIVWTDEDDGFILCWGFVVEEFLGE